MNKDRGYQGNRPNRPSGLRRVRAWLALLLALLASALLLASTAVANDWGFQTRDSASGPGAVIVSIAPQSAAAAAGLAAGDVILQAEGFLVTQANDLANILRLAGDRPALTLLVARAGWEKRVTLSVAVAQGGPPPAAMPPAVTGAPSSTMAPAIAPPAPPAAMSPMAPAAAPYPPQAAVMQAAPPDAGPRTVAPGTGRTIVAVGEFQVKAANASQAIGVGLREIIVTSLFNRPRFIVVERGDVALPQVAGEQQLSRSRMARTGEAIPERQMDIADVMVFGAVTEFEPEARGGGLSIGLGGLPVGIGMQSTTAHMALDIRVVDTTNGRVLGAKRFVGEARAGGANISAAPRSRGYNIPVSLSSFKNTPMEQAIRSCLDQAIEYVAMTVPPSYFHHE
jgi:curli biogenesis system outer membrane secretion channel CsgG